MKKKLLVILKCLFTLIVFSILLTQINLSTVCSLLRSVQLSYLFLALMTLLIQTYICILRWHLILRFVGLIQPISVSLQIYWAGIFFNSILPTGVGGDLLRLWMIKNLGGNIYKNINSILLDRLLALLTMILVVWISIPVLQPVLQNTKLINLFKLAACVGLGGFIALSYAYRLPDQYQFRSLKLLRQLSLDLRALWASPKKTFFIVSTAVVGMLVQIITIYLIGKSLNLSIQFVDCLVLVPPIILIMTLPVSMGGWGLREGAMVTFFGMIGVSTTASLSLSIIFGCLVLLMSLPGGIFWIIWQKRINIRTSDLSAV